jgi:hypothetical protein
VTLIASLPSNTLTTMSMSMKTGSTMHFEPGSWQEAVYDVYIGTLVGTGHFLYFFKKYTLDLFVLEPYYYLTGQKEAPELPDAGDLKIVGIGFGRTGTVGEYNPCVRAGPIVAVA